MTEERIAPIEAVEPHDADLGRLMGHYVQEAQADFFDDNRPVSSGEWAQASVGLITLLVLGGIILTQVL